MDDSRKKLYNALSTRFDLGTFEEFDNKMGYEESRQKLYEIVSKDFDLGDYDTFNAKLGNTYQMDKDELEQKMGDWTMENGSFMEQYEANKSIADTRNAFSDNFNMTPEQSFVYDNAQEYGKKHAEIEEMRNRYYSNPLVIQQREGNAGMARQMAESFAESAHKMDLEDPELSRRAAEQQNIAFRSGTVGFMDEDVVRFMDDKGNYGTANRLAKEAQDIYAAPSKYDNSVGVVNFLKGGKDIAKKEDFWTMGMTGIIDNLNARDALMKIQDKLGSIKDLNDSNIDQHLTPSEKALVTAFAMNVMAQAERANDLSRGYQAGQGAMESLGFMAQFLLTGGIGESAVKGLNKGVAKVVSKGATESLTRWLAGQLDNISSKAVKTTAKTASKGLLSTINSVTKATVMTPLVPSNWKTVTDKLVEIDDTGKLLEADDAFWYGMADAMIETWSENAGGMVESILGVPLGLGKKAWNKALGDTAFGRWGSNLTRTPVYNIMKQAGWNGYIGEMGEEWLGNSVRTLTGLDPDALKNFATVDNQIVTMASFAPMSVFGLGASAAQFGAARRRSERAAEALAGLMRENGYSEEQISFTLDDMNSSTPRQLSKTLTPVVNQIAKDTGEGSDVFRAVMDYADARAKYNTLDGFYQREQEYQLEDVKNDILANTGRQFWQTRDVADGVTSDVVEVAVNEDGTRMFVTGESEDGTLAVVKENGEVGFASRDDVDTFENMTLKDFLSTEVIKNKEAVEKTRMQHEYEEATKAIREAAAPGTQINIGTVEAPVMGQVIQHKADGLIVQTEAGVSQLTWEEVGRIVGISATPLTDQEIESEEIAQIEEDRAERLASMAQTEQEEVDAVIEEVVAQEEMEQTKPLPLKADGSVDQTSLWNEDPVRWAQWNDQKRNDNGANSLEYITNAIATEQAALAQMQQAYKAETDFDARDTMEQQINAKVARLQTLTGLQQQYAAAQQQVTEQAAQQVEEVQQPYAASTTERRSQQRNREDSRLDREQKSSQRSSALR